MIRKAQKSDLSRIAEIYVFNNRIHYFPIFQDEGYSFKELQVVSLIEKYFSKDEVLEQMYVYDDGIVRGFLEMKGNEIYKLYVDPFFQSQGFGQSLINYAITQKHAIQLWALEKNERAIAFYIRNGFSLTGQKQLEDGTTEYLVELHRKSD